MARPSRTFLILAAALAAACSRPASRPHVSTSPAEPATVSREDALAPVPFERLPAFVDDGDWESLELALERSRGWLARRPANEVLTFGPRCVGARELAAALDRVAGWLAEDPTPETFAARVAQAFEIFESVGGDDGGMLITGYYEPVIDGSLKRTREYDVPVYAPPDNLIRVDLGDFSEAWKGMRTAGLLRGNRLVPFPDRRGIRESGVLRGREIAWARDPVDLFFIEVQGSGALRLPGGRELRIGYAGANGREYRSIGRLLIDEGKIEREKVSMQSIRAYLVEHPEEIERVLDYNRSFVFFRRLDGPPVGALGFPVTPRRTIATDQGLFPPGALGFLASELPALGEDGRTVAAGPLTRFVLNQDRGGAIRGAGRADFFWGRGEEAATRAGLMKQPGRLFFLVPKTAEEPEP